MTTTSRLGLRIYLLIEKFFGDNPPTGIGEEIEKLVLAERERCARIAESDLGLVWIHPQHTEAVQSAIARKIREGDKS